MERVVNMARGCCRVEVTGSNPANFLNLMARDNLPFWDSRPEDGYTMRVTVYASDCARARRIAQKCQCDMTILAARGTPVARRRLKHRRALLAAVCAALMLLAVSSLFVWRIDVAGTDTVSRGEILRALSECGVSVGAYWPDLNADMIRDAMILKIPQLSWMTVNMRGGRAQVLVRERTSPPVLVDNDEGYSLVARATGIVERMSVLNGAPAVKAGDAVIEGETLVSGVMTDLNGKDRLAHAMGDVWARTYYELTMRAPLTLTEKTAGGLTKTRYALRIGGTRINFYSDSGNVGIHCDKIIFEQPLGAEGVFVMPVTLIKEKLTPYKLTETARDAAALESELRERLTAELLRRINGGEIAGSTFSVSEKDGMLTVTMRAECLENIAEEVPIVP